SVGCVGLEKPYASLDPSGENTGDSTTPFPGNGTSPPGCNVSREYPSSFATTSSERPAGSAAQVKSQRDSIPPTASVSRPSFVAHTSSSPRNAGVTYSAGSSCGVKSVISPLSTSHR